MKRSLDHPKTIKTSCGIDKYHQLKSNKSFWGRFRTAWFVAIATIRDFSK